MEPRERLIAWLKDAYAMEKALVPILENHAKDADGVSAMHARLSQHAQETEQHAELVRGCLEQLGEKPSTMKNLVGKIFGGVQAPATGPAKDELVKNALADFATENFEIACYRALVIAAEDLGETRIAEVCAGILRDEEAMATWLDEQLPVAVRDHLHMARA